MSNPTEDISILRERIARHLRDRSLPDHDELLRLLVEVNGVLTSEDRPMRPRDSGGMPGGLVLLDPTAATVVLPDIHARPGLLWSVLNHELDPAQFPGTTVLEAVADGKAQIVCVGDYFHGEGRVRGRWREAFTEFSDGFRRHEAMDQEMRESLEVIRILSLLKICLPRKIHLLKGNHENVANESAGGNQPFGKFAYEGAMVLDFIRLVYNDRILAGLYYFEKNLPLLAVGKHFLISHAEPARLFTYEEILEYRSRGDVVYGMTWTDDEAADPDAVDQMIRHYLAPEVQADARYFGGHRPVSGHFNLRGRYVQIHNPSKYLMAVLPPDRPADPVRDIVETGTPEDASDGKNS